MANVVELRVGLHCDDECIKKIFKAIKKMDGIETYDVVVEQNKVVVTGNVRPEKLIKALHNIRKQAAVWAEGEVAGR